MAQGYKFGIGPDTEACANCKHFYQHYVLNPWTGIFETVAAGHCCYPRVKDRKVDSWCERFEWRDIK